MPRDAEAWLAERGIRREPIRVTAPSGDDGAPEGGAATGAAAPGNDATPGAAAPGDAVAAPAEALASDREDPSAEAAGPALSARDAARLAGQAASDARLREADAGATPDPAVRHLEDDVAEAVAFVRRSTSATPQSEGRVRDKLAERGWPTAVIEQAMDRARNERLVDDRAMVAALVEERQRKGHAPARIRRDLRERGFDEATLDVALRSAEEQDQEAAAFAVARAKAARTTGLTTEAAFRRVVGHVSRRGYPEALARKVAREAVFTTRDQERTAGH